MACRKNILDWALLALIGVCLFFLLKSWLGFGIRQREMQMKKEPAIRYLLYLPAGYSSNTERWPLVLFLHGAGTSGNDLEMVRNEGLSKLLESQDYPFIVVSPQSDQGGWDADALNALLDEVIGQNRVDEERVYVTGLSMGGFGTWELASHYPKRFAAIAPICGGGNPELAKNLQHVAVWAFHGAKDKAVPLSGSQKMVEALKEIGAEVEFTVYPNTGHNSWTKTYDNPKLYEWLLRHKRFSEKPHESKDAPPTP
jgi:predicted peptidase